MLLLAIFLVVIPIWDILKMIKGPSTRMKDWSIKPKYPLVSVEILIPVKHLLLIMLSTTITNHISPRNRMNNTGKKKETIGNTITPIRRDLMVLLQPFLSILKKEKNQSHQLKMMAYGCPTLMEPVKDWHKPSLDLVLPRVSSFSTKCGGIKTDVNISHHILIINTDSNSILFHAICSSTNNLCCCIFFFFEWLERPTILTYNVPQMLARIATTTKMIITMSHSGRAPL